MTQVAVMQVTNCSSSNPTRNDEVYQHSTTLQNNSSSLSSVAYLQSNNNNNNTQDEVDDEEEVGGGGERKRRRQQLLDEAEASNFVGLFVTAFRRSVFKCSSCELVSNMTTTCSNTTRTSFKTGMEIGVPTNVRHVAHVTFDRFNGFLGLPVEFEPEVPRRPPSASTTVFGVSTNSMQLSFDTRGNSVPTILLMMQHRLYALGGLHAEGIFRINPDNGQEESVRDQLNRGLLPEDVDVHSLAGLIKAWFRELPTGVLDCLSPEQVMQSQTEQECTELTRLLPPTEFALLDWAINLMSDVAQFEHLNKMNARNIAMVFAPNMTHMADPLTALMHAVQVMNFLKTLIEKTLRERDDSILIDSALDSIGRDPSSGGGNHYSLQTILEDASDDDGEEERTCAPDHPHLKQDDDSSESTGPTNCKNEDTSENSGVKSRVDRLCKIGQTSTGNKQSSLKGKERPGVKVVTSTEKAKGSSLVSSMNLRANTIEAWR